MVAAILHLGNIEFVKGKDVDSSKLKDDKSLYHLKTAAELLMLELGYRVYLPSQRNFNLLVSYNAKSFSGVTRRH